MKIYGYILAFIAIVFFSFNGIGGRFLTTDEALNPAFVVFLRYLGGTAILLFFIPLLTKKGEIKQLFDKENNILKNKNFWISSVSLFLCLVFLIGGMKYSSASNVVLIESLSPVLVGLITLVYYKNRKFRYSYKQIFYILIIATIGSSLLVSDSSLLPGGSGAYKWLGDSLAFVAMIFFAIFGFFYVELRRDFDKANGLIITTLFLIVGLVLSFPTLFIYFDSLFGISKMGWGFLAIVSFGSTGIAYLTWFLAGRYLSAIMLAMLFNIVGVTTILSEYMLYGGEDSQITYKLYLGAFIILASVSYMNYLTTEKKDEQ